ncbi:MAG: hypothetical protein Kow0031_00010 [Anaerolineae bacterium]
MSVASSGATDWVSDRFAHLYLAGMDGQGKPIADSDAWQAEVTVNVIDADGEPVSNARVVGDWKQHSGQNECITDVGGHCTLLSDATTGPHATFVVNRIQHEYLGFHSKGKLNNEGNPAERTVKVSRPKQKNGNQGNAENAAEPPVDPAPAVMPEVTPTPTEGTAAEPAPEQPGNEPTEEATPDGGKQTTEEATSEPAVDPTQTPTPTGEAANEQTQ